jgi:hypothetical protein
LVCVWHRNFLGAGSISLMNKTDEKRLRDQQPATKDEIEIVERRQFIVERRK